MESDKQVKLIEGNGTFGDIIFADSKDDFNALTNRTFSSHQLGTLPCEFQLLV